MRTRRPRPAARAAAAAAAEAFVPPDRLARWVTAGLADPPRRGGPDGPELHLHDATLVRSLCDPAEHPRPRLRRTLDRLRAWLPASADPPRAVTLVSGDGVLLVRLPDGTLADPSGQFRFDFTAHPATLGRLGPPAPTSAAEWHELGIAQDLAGNPAAAADSYARALLLAGPDVQVTFDLAHALADMGELARATERYRQVLELDPLRSDAWVNLGDLLLSAGSPAAAIDAFRHALDLSPDDPAAHYDLADALDAAARPAAAVPHWDAFLRLADGPPAQVAYARGRLHR